MNEVHIRALHRAAQLKGGVSGLASYLAVSEESLLLWMDAKAAVPSAIFLKAIDLVLAADMSDLVARPGDAAPASGSVLPRILVVDDDLGGAYSLARLIKQLGYPVETATSGSHAIEIALRIRPDIVFLDLRMPDMHGCDVAARLRAEGLDARIIAATAYGSDEDRRRTSTAGFAAHLIKPIDAHSLASLLPRLH